VFGQRALGYEVDAPDIPVGKVANLTTDTTAVMRATATVLTTKYPLFHGLLWTPCSYHVLNLYLQDQHKKVDSVKGVLAKGKLVALLFHNGAMRRLFIRCVALGSYA
jgi:hypothetical protein